MTTVLHSHGREKLTTAQWASIGLVAAIASILAVLIVQAVALAVWPELALFRPLESFSRSALFTAVPAFAATGIFAWLSTRKEEPVGAFVKIAGIVLLLSFIPDYVLPVPHRTLLASTVAAFLHLVAAVISVSVIVGGYKRLSGD